MRRTKLVKFCQHMADLLGWEGFEPVGKTWAIPLETYEGLSYKPIELLATQVNLATAGVDIGGLGYTYEGVADALAEAAKPPNHIPSADASVLAALTRVWPDIGYRE